MCTNNNPVYCKPSFKHSFGLRKFNFGCLTQFGSGSWYCTVNQEHEGQKARTHYHMHFQLKKMDDQTSTVVYVVFMDVEWNHRKRNLSWELNYACWISKVTKQSLIFFLMAPSYPLLSHKTFLGNRLLFTIFYNGVWRFWCQKSKPSTILTWISLISGETRQVGHIWSHTDF